MLKLNRTYTDFSGNQRTEDFFFNLTKAECLEMEMSTAGGMQQMMQRIIDAQDMPTIIATFKKIILQAYGEKSPDGKRFIKSKELSEAFSQTNAYSDLFMELSTDADAASKFVNGIVPKDVEPGSSIPAPVLHPVH